MSTLTVQEIQLFGQEFHKELVRLHETKQSQSYWAKMIMPMQKIQEIIDHLKGINPLAPGKECQWVESRQFKVFSKQSMGMNTDILMEPAKEKGAMHEARNEAYPRYLRIIPREDIFNFLLEIHLENNHSTLRETVHLVRKVASNIPRYLIHKFILLCPVCSNNGATTNSVGLPYTPSRRCQIKARRRRKLMDQFQVDILDLKNNPDGDYAYILHCMDHITGFHWLFPLAQIDAAEVAQNLVWGIFSLFGFPTELVSDYGKAFASQVIEEVTKLWPDELHIKNYLEGNSYKGDITRRNARNVTRFIDDMAVKKAAQGDNRLKWSEWLPEIQFMLNATVLDVRTGKTPYEKVFRAQPITSVPKTKFVGNRIESVDPNEQFNISSDQAEQEQVMEEIVDDRDMAVMHHDMAISEAGGVVVVDVGGVEHTIQTQHAPPTGQIIEETLARDVDGTHASAFQFEEVEASEDGINQTVVSVSPCEAYEEVSAVNAPEAAHIQEVEQTESEQWVTIAPSGELQVSDIQPSLQQVKLASSTINTGIRIEDNPKKAMIVQSDATAELTVTEGDSANVVSVSSLSPVKKGSKVIQLNSSKIGNVADGSPVVKIGASQAIKLSSNIPPIKRSTDSKISNQAKRQVLEYADVPDTSSTESNKLPATVRTRIIRKEDKDQLNKARVVSKVPDNQTIVVNRIISKNTIQKDNKTYELEITGENDIDFEEDEDQYGVLSDEEMDYYDGEPNV